MLKSMILDAVIGPVEPEGMQVSDVLVYIIPVVIIGIAVVAWIYYKKKH